MRLDYRQASDQAPPLLSLSVLWEFASLEFAYATLAKERI